MTLLGLMLCTGLRVSEARKLTCRDVDLRAGVIVVREGKFRKSRQCLGWSAEGRARMPRLQDTRHTFVVTRLLRWHAEGVDVDHRISALATYLGHAKVSDTYWYLSAVPELMAVVGDRFEHFARQRRGGDS